MCFDWLIEDWFRLFPNYFGSLFWLQSARGAKRRVRSSSSLSSDDPPDIISMIRYSPTQLPAPQLTGGREAGAGRAVATASGGSICHLSARNAVTAAAPRRPAQPWVHVSYTAFSRQNLLLVRNPKKETETNFTCFYSKTYHRGNLC